MPVNREPDLDPVGLSSNAKKMAGLQNEVLLQWGQALRARLKEAEHLSEPVLIDTFPKLYQNLVEAISPDYPRTTADQGDTVASEHGGERARLTDYKPDAIILEFQLLRWTIFDVLSTHGVELSNTESSIIHDSFDESIRESVSAFALAQATLRDRFVAALTHDLRTPLFTALVSAELIQESADAEKIKKFAGHIVNSLRRVDSMIQDLLNTSALHSGDRPRLHLREFDLYRLANEICEEFTTRHGPRFQCTGLNSIGWWDGDAVKRAVENLVGNAIKYGAPEKLISIDIRSLHGRTILAVHNEGEPIPPDEQESVFRAFQRAAAAKEGDQQGWGIGLSYVRTIAESHGGSIAVDSAAGRGTTLTLDMPTDARPFQNAPTLDLLRDTAGPQ